MKKTIIIACITLFTAMSAAAQDMDKFYVQVDGLGCPFCAYGLEKKFKEFKGIKDVAIEIETGDFSFSYPADKALTMEAVENQVVKAGYTPITTKVTRADGKVENSEDGAGAIAADAQLKNEKIFVAGVCGMCQARIEKATSTIAGISSATWDKDTKMLSVSYDGNILKKADIEQAIAKVGHDTKGVHATDEAYKSLPPCCKYDRIQ
ncbi:MAG: heavy metal transporter [Cytophagaceae bacterium]|nr:heavy metal transporter [Cytophagaceae bacterium]|tara:strand:+ start:7947 stop:8567 length:621 start_codon:yes stop_codon:yes gene_type:complete